MVLHVWAELLQSAVAFLPEVFVVGFRWRETAAHLRLAVSASTELAKPSVRSQKRSSHTVRIADLARLRSSVFRHPFPDAAHKDREDLWVAILGLLP